MSDILPSIITLVSRIFGDITSFLLSCFLPAADFFRFNNCGHKTSSFFLVATFKPKYPKKTNDIKLEDLKEIDIIKNNLHIYIRDNSKKILDKNSIKFLKKEHEFVEKDMKQFLEKLRTTDFEGFDKLQEEIYQLLTKILNDNHIVFYKLFLEYCSMIFPYLFYYFNDLKVKEEDKKVKKVKDIFITQAEKICNDFKICLERVI